MDGLRAVAVIPVILFHAGIAPFAGGYVGVDVFFVISGYLITSIIWNEIKSGQFSLSRFYERRARRILPPLYLVLILTVPFAWLWMMPGMYKDYSEGLIGVITFVSNVVFWLQTGYFAPVAEENVLLHTWSLSVEEQFYLIFPIFLLIFSVRSRFWLIITLSFGCIISLAFAEYSSYINPTSNFYLLPSRAWELGIGALVAFIRAPPLIPAIKSTLAAIGILLIIGSIVFLNENTPFPGVWAIPSVVGAALVLAFSHQNEPVGKVLSAKILVSIGLLSYSAYLFHQPLFAFSRLLNDGQIQLWLIGFLIFLTFILAQISYTFVETPFRNKQQVSLGTLIATLSSLALLLLAVGSFGIMSDGAAFRRNGLAGVLAEQIEPNVGLSNQCNDRFTLDADCRTAENPDILVWGDSYAMHLIDMVRTAIPKAELIQHTKSACAPVLELAPIVDSKRNRSWAEGCMAFNREVKTWIEQTPSLRYAVLSSPFRAYVGEGRQVLFEGEALPGEPGLIARELINTVAYLEANGIAVILVSSPPSNGENMGMCMARRVWRGSDPSACKIALPEYEEYDAEVLEIWRTVAERTEVIMLSDYMCKNAVCDAFVDQSFLYMDHGHLSKTGATFLGSDERLSARIRLLLGAS